MAKKETTEKTESTDVSKLMCGIVMPISEIDGCSENHWQDVYAIISQATELAGFRSNLVSNSNDVGVIQKRIIQNLYDNPIVVCDVSGKNPNVMFELGLRLAFDKPTIIIKDDKTKYSFDTSPIEHLDYPRDLRFSDIVEFKELLSEKIIQTHKKAKEDPKYSTFLKHFGSFKIAEIETEVVSKEDFILEEIKSLRDIVTRNSRSYSSRGYISDRDKYFGGYDNDKSKVTICFGDKAPENIELLIEKIGYLKGIKSVNYEKLHDDHCHLEIDLNGQVSKNIVIKNLERITAGKTDYIR